MRKLRGTVFLAGFLFFQMVISPSELVGKASEWSRKKGKRNLHRCIELFWSAFGASSKQKIWNYSDFLSSYESLPFLQKLRNTGRFLQVKREMTLFTIDPTARSIDNTQTFQSEHCVLIIATNSLPYTQSGYTLRTHETAKALVASGMEVQVVTRYGYPLVIGERPVQDSEVVDGIRYWRVLPRAFHPGVMQQIDFAVDRASTIAQSFHANIVLTTTDFHNAIVAQRVAARLGVPWIYEMRGEQEKTWLSKLPAADRQLARNSDKYLWTVRQEAKFAQDADAVVTLASTLSDVAISRGVSEPKIFEIPNAIGDTIFDIKLNKQDARRQCGLPDENIIGYVGSIVRYEGLELLLYMVALDRSVRVLIVGDGEDLPRLMRLAQALGVEGRVHFVGWKRPEEVAIWYKCLDMFVVPREDWDVCRSVPPLKVLTAMALGVPILSADLPALRYITGNLGTYVKGRSADKYLDKMQKLLEAPPDPEPLIQWAKSHTWSRNAVEYEVIFNRLKRRNSSKIKVLKPENRAK